MGKWYGSLDNRLGENNMYVSVLKVGTLATVYYYSDRDVYEIIEVKNQKNVKIRKMDAIRTDNNGASDMQSYTYKSNENNEILELRRTKYGWYRIHRYTLDLYNKVKDRMGFVLWDDEILDKVMQGREVTRKYKINISFGLADYYYDYSF